MTLISYLLDESSTVFGQQGLFRNYKLPKPLNIRPQSSIASYVPVKALWTKDEFRPRWNNLAVIVDELTVSYDDRFWNALLEELSVPLGVFAKNNTYVFLSRVSSGDARVTEISKADLYTELERYRQVLFSPRALGTIRSGQLMFADLEDSVTERSFTFLTRQKAVLENALRKAVEKAKEVEIDQETRKPSTTPDKRQSAPLAVHERVLSVATAYMAARILEDKGFFGESRLPTSDPKKLLEETVSRRNGFFKKALEDISSLGVEAQQQIAFYLGPNVTFSLVDHHDVGHLYEQALVYLRDPNWQEGVLKGTLINLQQHYTPVAIAEIMLDRLPLERLRPSDRRIMDLAAGSGSLLLAATRRLALMSDIPEGSLRAKYLAKQVAGNDIDPHASIVTRLRYTLVQESIGHDDKLFPVPARFDNQDYTAYTKTNLPNSPKVWVANPPFAEREGVQQAFEFVEMLTTWMSDEDQFALILPHSFLSGSIQGASQTRKKLSERCHIFETWQLPEGVVGLSALQEVCVVLGAVGNKNKTGTIARTIVSRANKSLIRDKGFLGTAWLANNPVNTSNWDSIKSPSISYTIPTVSLQELYFVFSGVTPRKEYPPLKAVPEGVPYKRLWKIAWREKGKLWADPEQVDNEQRYIRYSNEYLERPALTKEALFDRMKIFIARVMNRDTNDPLAAHLDTTGFCPNNNVYCICSRQAAGKSINRQTVPPEWLDLNERECLLWLLGILSSSIAQALTFKGRNARQLPSKTLKEFPLPVRVDRRIIELTDSILKRDRKQIHLPAPDTLREQLDQCVKESYGNPSLTVLTDVISSAHRNAWQRERERRPVTVTGQVLDANLTDGTIQLYLDGISDDSQEAWTPIPFELPGWALDGHVFTADLSEDVKTFAGLAQRRWALRNFHHTPRPYLSTDELEKEFMATKELPHNL